MEYGKGGAGAAGPIAREMIKAYFGIEDKPARRPVSAQQAVLENADPAALVSDMQKLQAALQRPDGEHT